MGEMKSERFDWCLAKKSRMSWNLNWNKNDIVLFWFFTGIKYFGNFSQNRMKQTTLVQLMFLSCIKRDAKACSVNPVHQGSRTMMVKLMS